ncbi:MAG: hypothetical protein HYX54_09645 [Chloroflexi bacterium]|nr:hypothetical protein [Chloroflexota bacterium]
MRLRDDHAFEQRKATIIAILDRLGDVTSDDTGNPSISHFRSYDVDLFEAHEEFAMSYASETAIDCTGLRPLRPVSEEVGP